MNNSIWILISFYALGLGFLLGMYYSDSTESFERERKKGLKYKKEFHKEYNEKEYNLSKERLEAYKEYVKEVKRLFHDN